MECQGVASGVEDGAAVGNAGGIAELQAEAFDAGGQMPRIDAASIDGRLATHRIQTDPIEEGGQERVAAKCLVEPGDGRRGSCQRVREGEVDIQRSGWRGEELVKHHAVLRVVADGRKPDRDASKGMAFAILQEDLVLGLCTGKRSSSPG
jgi:hypothetical protein